jgi:radical SAM superfamily enzyme YgiQ (UPF0313 family)
MVEETFNQCKIDILFLDVYLDIITWGLQYNPGVASISSVLERQNIKTDYMAIFNQTDIKILLKRIRDNHIQFVGFTVTEPTLDSVSKLSKLIKKKFPHIYILCGGLHCILYPKEVVEKTAADIICIGEGEKATLKIINQVKSKGEISNQKINDLWIRKNKTIIKGKLGNLVNINKLPIPNRKIFYKNNLDIYVENIYLKEKEKGCITIVSRGCYFNCSFCGNWILNKKYNWKYRRILEPQKAVKQIKNFIKNRNYEYIIFIDAQFPTEEKWLSEFAPLYKKEINLPFTIQIRFGSFNKKTIYWLKKAGCYFIQIGLESGDDNLRSNILNKKIDRKLMLENINNLMTKGIKVGLNNMIGLPEEDPKKFRKTIKLNALLNPEISYLFIYYPYKGTSLYNYCRNHKMLKIPNKTEKHQAINILKLKSFKKRDIVFFYKNFQKLLYIYKKTYNHNIFISLFWKLAFEIYSKSPSERKGIIDLIAKTTEKKFFQKFYR